MSVEILIGDCREKLRTLSAGSVSAVVTSPPYYGLRDYAHDQQIGLEMSPEAYVAELVGVFRDIRHALADEGTVWLNLGDSYAGSWGAQSRDHAGKHAPNVSAISANQVIAGQRRRARTGSIPDGSGLKPKDLIGVPWRVAFALQADGWWLRSEIIWAKPNGMPGSQDDRCTSSHETIFMLSKSHSYWSDFDAIKTPPRESTLIRAAQDVQAQAGSHRAHGGTKATKGALGISGAPYGRRALGEAIPERQRRQPKQRGHGKQHAGFNERWDAMDKAEQMARPAMMRDVWFVAPASFKESHFAVMPDEVARRCILAGCPVGGVVLDPFGGAGTTGLVAERHGRDSILIELNPDYGAIAQRRLKADLARVSGADEERGLDPLPLFEGVAA